MSSYENLLTKYWRTIIKTNHLLLPEKKLSWRFMNFVKRGLRHLKIFTYFNSNVMQLLVLPAGNVIIFKVHLFPFCSVFFRVHLFCWLKQPPFRKFLFVCKKNNSRKKRKKTKYVVAASASSFSLLASFVANLRYISCNLQVRWKEK